MNVRNAPRLASSAGQAARHAIKSVTRTATATATTCPRLASVGNAAIAGPSSVGRASLHTSRRDAFPPPGRGPLGYNRQPPMSRFGQRGGVGGFGASSSGPTSPRSWFSEEDDGPPSRKGKDAQHDEFPRNEAIESDYVRLINPDSGRLDPNPVALDSILKNVDRARFHIVQVTPMSEVRSKTRTDADFTPIVRYYDRKVETEKRKKTKEGAKAAAKKNAIAAEPFVIQLTWQTTEHDLGHKVKQAKKFAAKKGVGSKIKISVNTKKGKKYDSGTQEEKEAFVGLIHRQMVGEGGGVASAAGEEAEASSSSSDGETNLKRNGEVVWEGGAVKYRAEVEYICAV